LEILGQASDSHTIQVDKSSLMRFLTCASHKGSLSDSQCSLHSIITQTLVSVCNDHFAYQIRLNTETMLLLIVKRNAINTVCFMSY